MGRVIRWLITLTFITFGLLWPLVGARECVHAASRSFLSRVFDGEVAPFLACFLEREKLTPEEIEGLRRILEEKR